MDVVGGRGSLAFLGEGERLVVLAGSRQGVRQRGRHARAEWGVSRFLDRRVGGAQQQLGLLGVAGEQLRVGRVQRSLRHGQGGAELRQDRPPARVQVARLVEAAAHRLEAAEHAQHRALRHREPAHAGENLALDRVDRRVHGRRAEVERVREAGQRAELERLLAGRAGVLELMPARPLGRAPAARAFVQYRKRLPRARQSGVVVELRHGAFRRLAQRAGPFGEARQVGACELGARLAGGACEHLFGGVEVAEVDECLAEQHHAFRVRLRSDRLGAPEQIDGGGQIPAPVRPATLVGQSDRRALGQPGDVVAVHGELPAQAIGLLQMVGAAGLLVQVGAEELG